MLRVPSHVGGLWPLRAAVLLYLLSLPSHAQLEQVVATPAEPAVGSDAAPAPAIEGQPAVAAQEVAQASAAPADEEAFSTGSFTTPEEVVVTARRRAESAQSVPIALTALSDRDLEASGTSTVGQLQRLAPSLQVFSFNPRNTNINIRGLGSNVALTNDGLENGVGVYVDQVYIGRPGASQFDLIDLERVEVLRGPQGTLFGKNTTAGAISITSRLPSFNNEFSGELTAGEYGYRSARASASGAISSDGSTAARVSVGYTSRDGFARNVHAFNDPNDSEIFDYENFTSRGQLYWRSAGGDNNLRLIVDHGRQRQQCCINLLTDAFTTYDNGSAIPNNFNDRIARLNYTTVPLDPFARLTDADAEFHAYMEQEGVSAEVNWTVPAGTLTSVTAYRKWDWDPANDADGIGKEVFLKAQQVNRQQQASQEIRLASALNERFDYVAGAYYFWQIVDGAGITQYGSDAAQWFRPATSPVPLETWDAALDGLAQISASDPETSSAALFGQGTWHATKRLEVTLGLRYTHEDKNGSYGQHQEGGADLSSLPADQAATAQGIRNNFVANIADAEVETKDDAVAGTLNLSYQLSEHQLAYATYSRGNKSGGLNLTALPAGVPKVVDPETVNHYEVGYKSQFFDRALTANLALFSTTIDDYQSSIVVPVGTGAALMYIDNVGQVASQGLEIDLRYALGRQLTLGASGSFVDAEYEDYQNGICPSERRNEGAVCDLSGEALPGVSKFSGSASVDWIRPIGTGLELFGRADYAYRESYNTNVSVSRYAEVDAYGLLNARIGLRPYEQRWEVILWAQNLLDEEYFQTLSVNDTGLVTSLVGDPRLWGVTGKLRF